MHQPDAEQWWGQPVLQLTTQQKFNPAFIAAAILCNFYRKPHAFAERPHPQT